MAGERAVIRLVVLLVRWVLRLFGAPTTRRKLDTEYAPRADGQPDPGEVVWTWVPYEDDPRQGKDRPVLIIGRRGRRLRGLALTSKPHDRASQIALGAGPWDRDGRISYVKLDRVLDIDPRAVRREGAALDRARFDRVVSALGARAQA